MKLRKTYKAFVGQNLPSQSPGWSTNLYGRDMMSWVAFSTRNGVLWMGQGADKAEALADLSLRMLGHDEEVFRFKVIEG